ncbi:hypothetical protein GSI_11273 [Ganoderma sinense ZZ0214-1]|uniref:BTB domain-containing protein n=1 Tax=Ganoderma sinense ZZ0214-1 TaxID=1077348 RepID=A0A2G8RZA6_9APHY|nr:hypothetical protein GSI_11273 [Ganoderma sinense ZZ0214-1]
MFSVPQPVLPAPSDVFNGQPLPVVHVSDSAHDFRQLLHMLYDGVRFMPPDLPVAFSVIAAVARLGHKYQIEPSSRSYEEWLKQGGRSSHLCDHILPFSWVEALNLIQLIGETDMLPLAIYHCCQSRSFLSNGTQRADGTVETLDPPMLERCACYNARTRSIQRQALLNFEIFRAGPSESCRREGGADE